MTTTVPPAPPAVTPARAARPRIDRSRVLVRALGGPRSVLAVGVDALGTGLLRPFLLLYGIEVLRLPAPVAGLAMTAGVVAGLGCVPPVGRWLDRGARSTAVAASMLVRVIGTVVLVAAPAGSRSTVWLFAVAALFLGIGNQAFPVAQAAVVAAVSRGRDRDAALAAGRSLRNAGLGVGALVATACLAGGTPALRALAVGTGLSYLVAATLAWSVRIRASRAQCPGRSPRSRGAPGMRALLVANVIYVFCLNVPEIALPLVLVTQLHASPMWAAGVFVTNTALVVTLQVPVTVWMSRFSRRTALAVSGMLLSVSYAGFLGAAELGRGWAAPAIAGVVVLCTLGEIIYCGNSTALVAATAPEEALGRALARFQLSTGFSLAISPAIMTALAAHGPAALWVPLAAATLLSAAAVTRNPGPEDRAGLAQKKMSLTAEITPIRTTKIRRASGGSRRP
jgi:MFS family permease